ncbi:MAG: hypothetical protein JWM02_1403 [Frankiales bacterium]|nr:hypothetical protein [Frankiales bacterium]
MTASPSIELPHDGACAFCAYLSGDRPYTVLARDALAAVLVTRAQRGFSHLLVIPVRHAPTILDLNDSEAEAVMAWLRQCARAIDLAEHRPGISVWQNNGAPAGQAISHFHFHIAGTLPQGGTDFGEVPEIDVSATEAIAQRLRAAAPSCFPPLPRSG